MKKMPFFGIIALSLAVFVPILLKGSEPGVRLAFTGDIIMHGPVRSCAYRRHRDGGAAYRGNRGFNYLFEKITPLFADSDITAGNMEFPIFPPYDSRGTVFNCAPEVLAALKDAGFTLLSIANNHIMDQGEPGFRHTVRSLEKSGIPFVGADVGGTEARRGVVIRVRGVRIGFFAATGVLNNPTQGNDCVINDFYDEKNCKAGISRLRRAADFVVLMAHFGEEYRYFPGERDRKLLMKYCDHGADLVVGHHPHVLQKAEMYRSRDGRNCAIFYSLGNFISNQTWENLGMRMPEQMPDPRDSIVLQCLLERKEGGISARYRVIPIVTVNRRDPGTLGEQYRDIFVCPAVAGCGISAVESRDRTARIRKVLEIPPGSPIVFAE